MTEQTRTYQTRLVLTPEQASCLDRYADLYGRLERTLFARLVAGESLNNLKRRFIAEFGVTARQFNAMAASVRGKIRAAQKTLGRRIESMKRRIRRAERVLARGADPAKHHQKKRRLATLKARLARLEKDRSAGKVRIGFGGRRLFRKQFALAANGFGSHREWLSAWRKARSAQFFVIGSKDETAGCQGCVATVEDGTVSLRLRLPNALGAGKYLRIAGLRFAYGHDTIVAAIQNNLGGDQDTRRAISYRFVRDAKGWRVSVTVAIPKVPIVSRRDAGVIGVDVNSDRLSVTETDRFGNPIGSWSIPCVTYGCTRNRRAAVIGNAVERVMGIASDRRKPIAIEKLDFSQKKASLEGKSARYCRTLSAFAYAQIHATLRARAYDAGIEVLETNPAFSSIIGKHKFQSRYGLSAHGAAAAVLARRVNGFGERLPRRLQVTLPLPVRNRGRHVWSLWAAVARRDRAAHVVQRRPGRRPRSRAAPVEGKARPATPLPLAGESPARESSPAPFGGRCGREVVSIFSGTV